MSSDTAAIIISGNGNLLSAQDSLLERAVYQLGRRVSELDDDPGLLYVPSRTFESLNKKAEDWTNPTLAKVFCTSARTAQASMLERPDFTDPDTEPHIIRRSHVRWIDNGSEPGSVESRWKGSVNPNIDDFDYRAGLTFKLPQGQVMSREDMSTSLSPLLNDILEEIAFNTNEPTVKREKQGGDTAVRWVWPLSRRTLTQPGTEKEFEVDVSAEISAEIIQNLEARPRPQRSLGAAVIARLMPLDFC